uniref:PKD domain-containing protein n=1 Tax=Petromyzon marinus TaxID=7757 RepID=S4REG1_PETMA
YSKICSPLGYVIASIWKHRQWTHAYRDAMGGLSFPSSYSPGANWMPDSNGWSDKHYPVTQMGGFIPECWPGGSLKLTMTNDGPALQGSSLTVKTKTIFPRAMWVADDGQVRWARDLSSRAFALSDSPDCKQNNNNNWGPWPPDRNGNNSYPTYPDGMLMPQPREHYKQREFVYVWHTQGNYYQTMGGTDAGVELKTATMDVGTFQIRVLVYHEGSQAGRFCPLANVSGTYTITDEVQLSINVSQSGDRNPKDNVFLVGKEVKLKATPYDPTGYLRSSNVTYTWDFGDGTVKSVPGENGSDKEHVSPTDHTYATAGTFRVSVEVQAVIPTPCELLNATVLPDPAPQKFDSSEIHEKLIRPCRSLLQYNVYQSTFFPYKEGNNKAMHQEGPCLSTFIFLCVSLRSEGIKKLQVVQTVKSTNSSSGLDILITCEGSIPTEVCTVIADELCLEIHRSSCVLFHLPYTSCALTLHQEFNTSGVYCVNITAYDDVGVSATST